MEMTLPEFSQRMNDFHCPYSNISPETFVKVYMVDCLHREFTCLNEKGNHKYSLSCKERLEILSTVLECFLFNPNARSRSNDTPCLNKGFQSSNTINDDVKRNQMCDKDKPCVSAKSDSGIVNFTESWYQHVSKGVADEDILCQLVNLQGSCQCIFASHLLKKIICTCAIQYDKIATVLHCFEEEWTKTKIVRGNELDLINSMISMKSNGDEECLFKKQVFKWLLESDNMSLLLTWLNGSSWSADEKFQDYMMWLSFVGKFVKYCFSSGKTIPVDLGNIVISILEMPFDNLFSSENSKHNTGHFVLFKLIKVFNKWLTIGYCNGKLIPCNTTLKCCEKLLQILPSIFQMCEENGFMKTIVFWGDNNDRIMKQQCVRSSHVPNAVLVKEMFLLAVKAVAVLVSATHKFEDKLALAFQKIWSCFQKWMEKCDECAHADSDWIPLLLSDQDDKWIEALLCLLIIYKGHGTAFDCEIPIPNSAEISLFWNSICPHKLFLQFAEFIYFDPSVISDFLMSPETNFLVYFTKYLAYLESSWDSFVSSCKDVKLDKGERCGEGYNRGGCSSKDTDLINATNRSNVEKRKHSNETENNKFSKLVKQNTFVSPLVSYDDTDSNSNSDNNSDLCTDEITASPYLPKCEIESKVGNIGQESKCTENNVSNNNGPTGNVSDDIVIEYNENLYSLASNVSLESSKTSIATSSPSSSLLSGSDEHDNVTFIQIPNESKGNNNNGDGYSDLHTDIDFVESVMTMLIRLRFQIERLRNRQLFPYDIDPLLRLISSCEEKYETI